MTAQAEYTTGNDFAKLDAGYGYEIDYVSKISGVQYGPPRLPVDFDAATHSGCIAVRNEVGGVESVPSPKADITLPVLAIFTSIDRR